MESDLVLEQIDRVFTDGSLALKNINLRLPRGTSLSILGPSGSGKTTLLRIIAGLETPDSGKILFGKNDITHCSPHKRNFGLMFQDFALFPHMNVFNNIAFGLKMKGMKRSGIKARVKEMLTLTGLENFESRQIHELSGGERQRVALARTLAPSPGLVMLDEPLSALDRVLRKRLLADLTHILSRLNITTIFVTHDHTEAFAAGNLLIVMNQGKIVQQGTRNQLVNAPETQWLKDFLSVS
ncbi:MAG: ABC transporter ATP-binding protein [Desulfobacteraceae bacterium]|nr:ABC transporter ATP-binding protein [Desulfobacteraceae bacterium]